MLLLILSGAAHWCCWCYVVMLMRIGAADLRDAALSFRAARAVSTDNFRPRHAALLSIEALAALAEMFHCFERLGCVANGLANLVAFIPKSDGGERAIGIILGVYALYEQARLEGLRKWVADHKREIISGLAEAEERTHVNGKWRCGPRWRACLGWEQSRQ